MSGVNDGCAIALLALVVSAVVTGLALYGLVELGEAIL